MTEQPQQARFEKSSLPSDASQVYTIARYEFLNYRRSRRFLILVAIVIGAGLAASAVIIYFRPPSMMSGPTSFLAHWLEYTAVFLIALPASFLGGDAISSEFQNKTGYSMVGNPVKRSSLFLGKMLAALTACLLMLGIFELITLVNAVYYFGPMSIPVQFWESLFFSVVAVAGALGLAFFFSATIKNGSISVLFTAFLLLYVFNLLQNVLGRLTSDEPWFLLNYGSQIIVNVFFVPYPSHVLSSRDPPTYFATVPEGLAIMACYFLIGMIASLLIFRHREFT